MLLFRFSIGYAVGKIGAEKFFGKKRNVGTLEYTGHRREIIIFYLSDRNWKRYECFSYY